MAVYNVLSPGSRDGGVESGSGNGRHLLIVSLYPEAAENDAQFFSVWYHRSARFSNEECMLIDVYLYTGGSSVKLEENLRAMLGRRN
jgi:hypothetical protein